jgi:hypothetical protein
MNYPVRVDVRLDEGAPALDELQREGAASLISGALSFVAGADQAGDSGAGLVGFQVTAHPLGALLVLSLDAPELEMAERAARQIAEQVLRGCEPLSGWRVSAVLAPGGTVPPGTVPSRGTRPDPHGPDPDDPGPPAVPSARAGTLAVGAGTASADPAGPAGPRPDWGEIAEARARMAASARRLRAFGLEAFGYAGDDAGSGVSRQAAELAAGALVRSIEPMLDTLFDDCKLLRGDATAAGRSGLVVLDGLSPRFQRQYDSSFARRFLVAAATVTGRLTQPAWEPPACAAEELALRLLIDWADARLEECHLLSPGERDAAFGTFAGYAFDDADHELLFEPRFGGVDSDPPGSRPAVTIGVAQWFEPFGEHQAVHAYALGPENGGSPRTAAEPDDPGDPGELGDPAREAELIGRMLTERVGIDPDVLGQVADLLAIGVVHGCWRNTRVEDWHADGRLSDADMLRINSLLTRRVREVIGAWAAERGLSMDGPTAQLDGLTMPDVEELARALLGLLTNPARRLPNGATLAGLAGSELGEYEQEAALALGGFAAEAQARGIRFAVTRAAGHGGLACPHWWSHPSWPAVVSRFVAVLDEPASEHWGPGGEWRKRLPPEPAVVRDRDELRRVLLASPWQLSTEAARWVVAAGIGLLRPRM